MWPVHQIDFVIEYYCNIINNGHIKKNENGAYLNYTLGSSHEHHSSTSLATVLA